MIKNPIVHTLLFHNISILYRYASEWPGNLEEEISVQIASLISVQSLSILLIVLEKMKNQQTWDSLRFHKDLASFIILLSFHFTNIRFISSRGYFASPPQPDYFLERNPNSMRPRNDYEKIFKFSVLYT